MDRADAVVVILWNCFGTVGARGWTGTQEEVLRAFACWTATGRPRVMLYFCRRPASLVDDEALDQRRALLAFQRRLPPALIARYETLDEFKATVEQHLRKVVAQLPPVRHGPRAPSAAAVGRAATAAWCWAPDVPSGAQRRRRDAMKGVSFWGSSFVSGPNA